MMIEKAIERLKKYYDVAEKSSYVKNKTAWALYQRRLRHWLYCEPPKWKLLQWLMWKHDEPKEEEDAADNASDNR